MEVVSTCRESGRKALREDPSLTNLLSATKAKEIADVQAKCTGGIFGSEGETSIQKH